VGGGQGTNAPPRAPRFRALGPYSWAEGAGKALVGAPKSPGRASALNRPRCSGQGAARRLEDPSLPGRWGASVRAAALGARAGRGWPIGRCAMSRPLRDAIGVWRDALRRGRSRYGGTCSDPDVATPSSSYSAAEALWAHLSAQGWTGRDPLWLADQARCGGDCNGRGAWAWSVVKGPGGPSRGFAALVDPAGSAALRRLRRITDPKVAGGHADDRSSSTGRDQAAGRLALVRTLGAVADSGCSVRRTHGRPARVLCKYCVATFHLSIAYVDRRRVPKHASPDLVIASRSLRGHAVTGRDGPARSVRISGHARSA